MGIIIGAVAAIIFGAGLGCMILARLTDHEASAAGNLDEGRVW